MQTSQFRWPVPQGDEEFLDGVEPTKTSRELSAFFSALTEGSNVTFSGGRVGTTEAVEFGFVGAS